MDSENTTKAFAPKQKTLRPWQSTEESVSEISSWDGENDFQMQLLKRLDEQKKERKEKKSDQSNVFSQAKQQTQTYSNNETDTSLAIDWSQSSSWPIDLLCKRIYDKWFADLENL